MNQPLVIIALELRSYRETIAEAVEALLPEARILLSEAGDLDRKAALLRPDVVICSHVSPAVEETAPFWVELYRDHGSSSMVKTPTSRREVPRFEISDLAVVLELSNHTRR